MIDITQILFKAGDGGNGRVSFRREKYVPKGGPDGGDGGDGGNIILRATNHYATLDHLSGVSEISAESGQVGGDRKKTGRAAEDTVVEVPVGTVIWVRDQRLPEFRSSRSKNNRYYLEKEGQHVPPQPGLEPIERRPIQFGEYSLQAEGDDKQFFFRFSEIGQEVVLCRSGRGGRGNVAFKGPALTTPLEAEYGTFGEQKLVVLELQLLADIGLVGLPNAGKSTFISRVTKARPKIANYPFTTLQPNLGIWRLSSTVSAASDNQDQGPAEVVVADIPGLIEGASQGKGLGYDFLRHVKACRALLYFVYLDEEVLFDESISDQEKVAKLQEQLQLLQKELREYDLNLEKKPSLVVAHKSDLYSEEFQESIENAFQAANQSVLFLSSATGAGLADTEAAVAELISTTSV